MVTLFGVKMSSIKDVRFRELLVDLVTGDVHTIFGRTKIKLSSRHGFKHLFKELLFKNDSINNFIIIEQDERHVQLEVSLALNNLERP